MVDYQKRLTNQIMPKVEAATPGSGSYLNEANFEQPGWQHAFYGSNYPRLRKTKQELDPLGVLFSQTAVGGEMWTENADGRLCRI